MPKTLFTYKMLPGGEEKHDTGRTIRSLSKKEFDSFNPLRLGIGDVAHQGKHVQALAVFYDLEGFTSFCNQRDSHLIIPIFLDQFVNWLFHTLANEIRVDETDDHVTLSVPFPFFSKFLGDGVLLLWDTDELGTDNDTMLNIVHRLHTIALKYKSEFVPGIQKQIASLPETLRCGIARGQIISVGDGHDYVGSCINVAARLQKLGGLRFAVARKGINLSPCDNSLISPLVIKQVEIRGIEKKELVYIFPEELEKLSLRDQKLFTDP